MSLLRSDFTRLLINEATEYFYKNYTEAASVWPLLFEERRINGPLYRASTMLNFGDLLPKDEDDPMAVAKPQMGWDYQGGVKTFAKSVVMSMEAFEDTSARGLFQEFAAQLVESYPRTRDRYYAEFFNKGALKTGHPIFNNSLTGHPDPTGNFIYDGKPFFADNTDPHPLKGSAKTIQNYFPLPLNAANLETVWTHMTTKMAIDENGNPIVVNPDTLLVPPTLQVQAMKILSADRWPHTDTTPSIGNPMFNRFNIVVWPALTNPEGWFLLEAKRGLLALTRKELEIDSYIEQNTKRPVVQVNCRYGGVVTDVRFVCACNTPQS